MISQIALACVSPARCIRSRDASVCPARTRTPPCRPISGKTCPGEWKASAVFVGSASALIVFARSNALIPVVVPSFASTLTVKQVPIGSVFLTISPTPISTARSRVIGAQRRPRAFVTMKLTVSGVTSSAAAIRSPSFSRPASSVMIIIRPWRSSWSSSSIGLNIVAKWVWGSGIVRKLRPAARP